MSIDEIVDSVVNGVHAEWPTIYKIRYAYVTLGKLLKKNTDFFFSVDSKLREQNMTFEEISKAYNDDTFLSTSVICKSSSLILKLIYDRLGIECKLVKSLNNVIAYHDGDHSLDINHWFLAVSDGENTYFCTLSSDLPYIQMGMETRHFGVNIPYFKKVGDTEKQVYEGEEIKHTVIDKTYLREIDIAIEYIKNQYHYDASYSKSNDWYYNYDDASLVMLSQELNSNKMYIDLEVGSTFFYQDLTHFKGENGREIDLFSGEELDLTAEDWNKWKRILCRFVIDRINTICFYKIHSVPAIEDANWNYDTWIANVCKQLQRYLFTYIDTPEESLYIQDSFQYAKWSRQIKRNIDPEFLEKDYDNILTILDKMNTLVSFVNHGKVNRHFSVLLNSMAYHFIHKANLFEESMIDGKASSKYIAHKFKKLFTTIFDCNSTTSVFNTMSYSEQIVIIKMILERMFKELNRGNSSLEEYDDNYSAVFNRIQLYSIKNRETGEYAVVFHILDDGTYADTYYFYHPKTNVFHLANILEIYSDYIIVSNRFKSRIEDLENIEVEPEKKIKS